MSVHIREPPTPGRVRRFCKRNLTLILSILCLSQIEKGTSLRREVYSVAEFRVKMSRLLALSALTLVLVVILSVEYGNCGSIKDWYVRDFWQTILLHAQERY